MTAPDPLVQALSDRYAIERELGAGGMGTVYLARDLRHDRNVALKVFRPEVGAAVGAERFLREIRLVASLAHPHILPLFDSGEAGDYLYYVTPYIEGESLRERIRREGPLPIPDAAKILRDVADALSAAHARDIVHRDLKPGNVLLSGRHALLADFGVAKALDAASGEEEGEELTAFGMTVGTPQYMAPEQAAGEEVDHRADLYALGILGYEMLTGRTPFQGTSSQAVLAAHLTQPPEPVAAQREGIPPALADAVMRCLQKAPEDRWQEAGELAGALDSMRTPTGGVPAVARSTGILGGGWRRLAVAGTVVVAVLVAGGMWISDALGGDEAWVREEAIPEIEELLREGLYDDAWAVARRAQAIAPEKPDVAQLLAEFTTPWSGLETDPPGARVLYRPYREPEAPWEELGTTPMDTLRLPLASASVLRLELDGYRPVQMVPDVQYPFARAPLFTLDPPHRLPEDMVRIPGWSQTIAGETVDLGDFYMDCYEVTNQQYQRFVDAGGYRDPQYWEHPFVLDGDTLSWEAALGQFTDRTGRPGPSTWDRGSYPEGQEDYPVGGISWYEAAAYADFAGKSLPTVYHWQRAYGSNFFRAHVIPQSNLQSDGPAPVGEHAGMGPFGTFDMAGNVREWCYNAVGEDRYILGGGWDDPDYLAMSTGFTQPAFDRSPTNGIRLVSLLDDEADAGISRALEPVEPEPVPDYRAGASPPGDEEFEVYRRMYAYDPVPLEPRIEKVDTARHWVEKTISFNAAYDGERMLLYLYLPRSARPPFQAVVYWSGSGMLVMTRTEPGLPRMFAEFIVQSGRALAFPVLKGTLERHAEQPPRQSIGYRDRRIKQVQDVMRTLDYLESRDDINADRLAYYGLSWGGPVAPLPLALDPRFTAAVLNVAGIRRARPQPEVDELNYLARVTLPVLMLSGRLDANFPLETSARPFFDLLGTPPEDKHHFVAEGGHFVPRPDLIRESLDWLDRYLGPVEGW
jgi:eukaryotic-like serine/threonine-protein kinase